MPDTLKEDAPSSPKPWVRPKEVDSPRQRWTQIDVLHPGDANKWAVAIGTWDKSIRLAVRWNGTDDNALGAPQARGNPTWLIVDEDFEKAILSVVPAEKRALANTLLGRT